MRAVALWDVSCPVGWTVIHEVMGILGWFSWGGRFVRDSVLT